MIKLLEICYRWNMNVLFLAITISKKGLLIWTCDRFTLISAFVEILVSVTFFLKSGSGTLFWTLIFNKFLLYHTSLNYHICRNTFNASRWSLKIIASKLKNMFKIHANLWNIFGGALFCGKTTGLEEAALLKRFFLTH